MEETTQIENTPKLTPQQTAILMQRGPFRVYAVNPTTTKRSEKLILIDPRRDGTLAEVAADLVMAKNSKGTDYAIEDLRTTRIIWTTLNLGVTQ